MSGNQSKSDRNNNDYKRSGRPNNPNSPRNFPGGGGRGGGGGGGGSAGPPYSGYYSSKSYKKVVSNNAASQGVQTSRVAGSGVNPNANVNVNTGGGRGAPAPNGAHVQPPLRERAASYGYVPARISPRAAYDPSSIQHQNMNTRNIGRVFDRLGPFSPPEQASVSTPPQSGSSDDILSEDCLHDKSVQTIKEFYSARDEKEVALCIKDLNAPRFYPTMISIWVTDSFERKDKDRDSLAKLLINLTRSQDGILSQNSLVRGFESVLSSLEDAINDAPKAGEFLGQLFAKVLLENVIPYTEVWRLIYEGGEEPGGLVKTGHAAEVLGVILEIIKSEKGDPFLKDLYADSNLRLENFRSPTNKKTSRLDKFF